MLRSTATPLSSIARSMAAGTNGMRAGLHGDAEQQDVGGRASPNSPADSAAAST